jgi:hypothetical protein
MNARKLFAHLAIGILILINGTGALYFSSTKGERTLGYLFVVGLILSLVALAWADHGDIRGKVASVDDLAVGDYYKYLHRLRGEVAMPIGFILLRDLKGNLIVCTSTPNRFHNMDETWGRVMVNSTSKFLSLELSSNPAIQRIAPDLLDAGFKPPRA